LTNVSGTAIACACALIDMNEMNTVNNEFRRQVRRRRAERLHSIAIRLVTDQFEQAISGIDQQTLISPTILIKDVIVSG